jgi:hypothetical protein
LVTINHQPSQSIHRKEEYIMSDHVTRPEAAAQYEPLRLEVLGAVHALTLAGKAFGSSDGDWLTVTGQGLMNAS